MARIIGRAAAVFIILHGIAHLMATSVYWKLNESPDLPYTTAILGGRIDLGETGIAFFGLLWLVAGLGTALAGVALLLHPAGARGLLLGITLFSLTLCMMVLEAARVGLLINLGILAVLVAGARAAQRATIAARARA